MNQKKYKKTDSREKIADGEFNLKIVSYCSGIQRGCFNEIQYLMEL